MSLIIAEGIDNGGKSTLVTRLAEDFKLLSMVNKQRPQSIDDISRYVAEITLLSCKYPIIHDRWVSIGESIYGPICRNTQLIDDEAKMALDWVTAFVNPLVIYCRPPLSTVRATFHERSQMEGVADNLDILYSAYDNRILEISLVCSVFVYDYSSTPYETLFKHVTTHLKGSQ